MIRIALATPFILTGKAVTTIGYHVAGAAHLNPHERTRTPRTSPPLRFRDTL